MGESDLLHNAKSSDLIGITVLTEPFEAVQELVR